MELMQRQLRYNNRRSFDLFHLCYYLSKASLRSEAAKLILDFKNYREPALRHFVIQSIDHLQKFGITKDLVIVRALGSNETVISHEKRTGLDRLGSSLANVFDCVYVPEILSKNSITGPIKTLPLAERRATLDQLYEIHIGQIDLNHRRVLIIDDVVTTGTTMNAIIEAILGVYPKARIKVFALAWTPTRAQQHYLEQQEKMGLMLNEPELSYGQRKKADADFDSGETSVSTYPSTRTKLKW